MKWTCPGLFGKDQLTVSTSLKKKSSRKFFHYWPWPCKENGVSEADDPCKIGTQKLSASSNGIVYLRENVYVLFIPSGNPWRNNPEDTPVEKWRLLYFSTNYFYGTQVTTFLTEGRVYKQEIQILSCADEGHAKACNPCLRYTLGCFGCNFVQV